MDQHLTGLQDMSPMTDLTLNLSGLTTQTETPCRRISWSNPHPSGQKTYFSDSPIALDSPTFQEGVLRGIEMNVRGRRKQRKVTPICKYLFSPADYDKENVHEVSEEDSFIKSSGIMAAKSATNFAGTHESQNEFSGASQESGFCESIHDKRSEHSFMSQSSVMSIRSSVFTDDEMEDEFFPADKLIDDTNIICVSGSMSQLLTKPLTGHKETSNPADCAFDEIVESDKLPMESEVVTQNFCREVLPLDKSAMDDDEDADMLNHHQIIKTAFKRPEPLDSMTPLQTKRRKSSPNVKVPLFDLENHAVLHRSYSETATTIMKAVQKADQQPDLIGDCSRPFALPLIHGRHQDLRTISPETLVGLIKGEYSNRVTNFTLIDCRYPYEYDGGHIIGAKNIFTKEDIYKSLLLGANLPDSENDFSNLIIFHCEFSSERAPKLLRFLRNKDRELNEHVYPRLHHPEIYLLEGGYKSFFSKFKELCEPQTYTPMLHESHSSELREFRSKSKSFGNENKLKPRLRSNLKF